MATGRDMRASLLLRFRDGASAGLDRVLGRLNRIGQAARRIATVATVAVGIGAASLAGPARAAAEFEDILRQSAITAGATGSAVEAMIAQNRRSFELLARSSGQSSLAIARAHASLIASGMNPDLVDRFMPIIARNATAAGAEIEDIGRLVRSLNSNLGITEEQMPRVLAALTQAGRDGNFELRDMARELPALTPLMAALGMRGETAAHQIGAAFQIAMRGAATTSEAANNLLNDFQKLASPETVRNFREVGVNLEALMASAARQGISPFEALVQRLRVLTGGSMFRLSELFGDRQALLGLLPMIQHTQDYMDIRDRAARAQPALVDQSHADRMRGYLLQLAQLNEGLTQLHRRVMDVAFQALPAALQSMEDLFAWIESVDERYPGLINQTVAWGAGLLLATTAIGLLGSAVGMLASGIRILLWPLVAAIGGIVGIIGIKVAVIIGVIAALAAGAYALWRYWDRIGPWFRELWGSVRGYFTGFVEWLSGWAGPAYDAVISTIRDVWDVLRTWFGTLWDFWVPEPFQRFATWVGRFAGAVMARAVADIQAAWRALPEFFSGIWAAIKSSFDAVIGPILAAIDRAQRFINSRSEGGAPTATEEQRQRRELRSGARRIEGWDAPEAPMMSRTPWSGEIVVRAAPGTEVVDTRSSDRRLPISAPDRGMSYGRP